MNELKSFIKKNKSYISIVLFFVLTVVFFQFLFLNKNGNDDSLYSVPAKAALSDAFYFMKYHYEFCNSRTLIHCVFIFLLKFDVYLWRIFIPVCFCSIPVSASAFISETKKDFEKIMPVMIASFFAVNAAVYSEALFWAAGSLNYVFPAALIMVFLLCVKKGKYIPLQLVLAFLCGATTEQYGIITVFAVFMIFLHRVFVEKNRKSGLLIVELGLSIAGYLTILLSPAIGNRMYKDETPLFYKFQFLFFNYWFKTDGMLPFVLFIGMCVCGALIIYNKGALRKLSVLYCVMLFAAITVTRLNAPSLLLAVCGWGYPAALIFGMVFIASEAALKKDFIPLGALLLGGGAQFMMMFTQRMSFRITMPSIFCFIVFCVSSLAFAYRNAPEENKTVKKKSYRFVSALMAAAMILIAAFNCVSYAEYYGDSLEKYKSGKSAAVVVDGRQTRGDIDEVIN